ncbi:MAG: DUF3667 domain-containing protein [Flavobacteriaceae bacterium]
MICINCTLDHNENFCPNCGEKAGVKRITITSIVEHAFSTITNMDKGLLFNIKNLTVNPAKIISDYILGKRKGILDPITFLILSISIYLVVESIIGFGEIESIDENLTETDVSAIGKAFGTFFKVYAKYFWILSILPLALSTKLVYKKYNFLEHVAISSFVIGFATLVCLIQFIIFQSILIFSPILYAVIWVMIHRIFSYSKDKIEAVFISFAAFLLFMIQLIAIILIIGKIRA